MTYDTHQINGRTSDIFTRSRIAEIASELCPIAEDDARFAYAALILGWVLRGDDVEDRYARTQSVERAFQDHNSDAWSRRLPGELPDTQLTWPDFQTKTEKALKFIGGES